MRYPIGAGTLYESSKTVLKQKIESGFSSQKPLDINSVSSLFVPNGSYNDLFDLYVRGYSQLFSIPTSTTFVILSPNSLKRGKPVAMSDEDWLTPFGKAVFDSEFAESIKSHSSLIEFDNTPHLYETSAEVQLPFISSIVPNPRIVVLSISLNDLSIVNDVVNAIETSSSLLKKEIILIGASDFVSSESQADANSITDSLLDFMNSCDQSNFKNFVNKIDSTKEVVNSSVFLIPYVYSLRKGFRPMVLGKKIIPTGIKDQAKSYVSIVYYK